MHIVLVNEIKLKICKQTRIGKYKKSNTAKKKDKVFISRVFGHSGFIR